MEGLSVFDSMSVARESSRNSILEHGYSLTCMCKYVYRLKNQRQLEEDAKVTAFIRGWSFTMQKNTQEIGPSWIH